MDEKEIAKFPYWSDDNICLRCDEDTKGLGLLYCWPCRREGSRNSGIVGPIFSYGGWC